LRNTVIDALEQSGSIYILLTLLSVKEIKTRELLRTLPIGETAAYTAIRKLLNANLIEDRREGYPVARIFSLTEKGRVVATHLKKMLEDIEKTG